MHTRRFITFTNQRVQLYWPMGAVGKRLLRLARSFFGVGLVVDCEHRWRCQIFSPKVEPFQRPHTGTPNIHTHTLKIKAFTPIHMLYSYLQMLVVQYFAVCAVLYSEVTLWTRVFIIRRVYLSQEARLNFKVLATCEPWPGKWEALHLETFLQKWTRWTEPWRSFMQIFLFAIQAIAIYASS